MALAIAQMFRRFVVVEDSGTVQPPEGSCCEERVQS